MLWLTSVSITLLHCGLYCVLFSKNQISALGPTLNPILTQSQPSYYFFSVVLLDSCIPLSNQLPVGEYLWLICPKIVSLLFDMQEF